MRGIDKDILVTVITSITALGAAIIGGLFLVKSSKVKQTQKENKEQSKGTEREKNIVEHINIEDDTMFHICKNNRSIFATLKKSHRNRDSDTVLLWIDIDSMTQINSIYGTDVGDKVAKTVCLIIDKIIGTIIHDKKVSCYRANKRDELFVMTSTNDGRLLGEIIVMNVSKYKWSELAQNLFVSVSVGMANYSSNATEMLKIARVSLNIAKSLGGNQVVATEKLNPFTSVNLDDS